ncbi:MAG: M28 family peptidase [Gemmatimonadota bacterium]|jgi:glutaminyl-peptide cyclotransferase
MSISRVVLLVLPVAACVGPAGNGGPTPGRPSFEGSVALQLVERQVAFGPRVPGRQGHATQLAWMIARLDSLDVDLTADTFRHITVVGDTLTLTNVLARFRPEESRRIVLLTHWDTRPTSDQADTEEARRQPVPGANDGASGTAVLLHLAGLLHEAPPPLGVDLLFVDGEDYGPGIEDMFLGARRYASLLPDRDRPVYGVLLDMVGDIDAGFPVEANSARHASLVVRKIWRAARRLGYDAFFPEGVGEAVYDDHVPLIEAGLPTANVIDLRYGPQNAYWHTPQDTPEHVSASTLGMVGEVVTELVYSGG